MAKINPTVQHHEFEDDLETTIHEIIHILGFSSRLMPFWINPETDEIYGKDLNKILKIQKIRGFDTALLSSKNVLQAAR